MSIKRLSKHLLPGRWRVRQAFPHHTLLAIEQAIKQSEATHAGQIRVAIEGALDGAPLFTDQAPRARALDVFSRLRVWDTEHNNGVLIYLLLADRDVEIVADRGFNGKVSAAQWQAICKGMEADFGHGRFEPGMLKGIAAVSELLREHYPTSGPLGNELPDAPVVL
jgi:uncharacterized membrane protein YgcG